MPFPLSLSLDLTVSPASGARVAQQVGVIVSQRLPHFDVESSEHRTVAHARFSAFSLATPMAMRAISSLDIEIAPTSGSTRLTLTCTIRPLVMLVAPLGIVGMFPALLGPGLSNAAVGLAAGVASSAAAYMMLRRQTSHWLANVCSELDDCLATVA